MVECHTLVDAVVEVNGTSASWIANLRNLQYIGDVVYDFAVLTEIQRETSRFSIPFISTNVPRPEALYDSTTEYTPVLGSPYSTLDNSSNVQLGILRRPSTINTSERAFAERAFAACDSATATVQIGLSQIQGTRRV